MTVSRAGLYALFALAATLVNFGVQAIVVRAWPTSLEVPVAVVCGTLAGLIVKYVLDKRYIFRFVTDGVGHDARLFVLYGVMSVVTTAIFWSSEFAFGVAFGTEAARFAGGALGLLVGYVAKYQLDRRFVFRATVPSPA